MQNNPLQSPIVQLLVTNLTFVIVVVTVGQNWTPEQVLQFFVMANGGYGAYRAFGRPGGNETEMLQTTPPTYPPDKALQDEIQRLEREIQDLLSQRDALVYVFHEVGLRVTVRPAR
ncbi:hypothetical protein G4Y79_15350 [Phototrophicus methaneseepsis]|uniref:Uncharacterized protein n=1 Tax=Phototrophicus methaneseepsis TaxID=2710758 RepID=A0A7S8E6B6_9CHLR|nr:hypothetical protein [Phototrophicus methaneseepsis]QPC81079.1 hypothetical protein G4Y79_15350 [Phototrophicus methaneseepsis]